MTTQQNPPNLTAPIFQAWLERVQHSNGDDLAPDWEGFSAGWEACRLEVFGVDVPPPAFDVENVGRVLLDGTHFTAQLWRLMNKSDAAHYARLALAFPAHAAALEAWKAGPNE